MGSASCGLPLDGDAVFVPGVGFRPAEVAIARVPVTREHAGRTITVERAAAGPDGTEIVLSDTGRCEWDNTQMAPWANDPVRLRDGSGHVFGQRGWRGGTGRRGSKDDPRIQTIQRELTLEPLPAGTRTADLLVGDAVLPLEFESSAVAGVRAVALDVTTSRHGVAVRAVRIARSAEDTAIELALSAPDDERRVVRAIGASPFGGPHGHQPPVTFHDDAGTTYQERQVFRDPG